MSRPCQGESTQKQHTLPIWDPALPGQPLMTLSKTAATKSDGSSTCALRIMHLVNSQQIGIAWQQMMVTDPGNPA